MSRFTEILLVSPLSDGQSWIIMRPFGYDVGAEGSGDSIEVPVGFVTDFATIPRLLWIVFPKWGRYGNAAVIHDWLYWTQDRPRDVSDRILREGMEVLSVGGVTRALIFAAVRAFGWFAWKRNQIDRRRGQARVRDVLGIKAIEASGRPPIWRQMLLPDPSGPDQSAGPGAS